MNIVINQVKSSEIQRVAEILTTVVAHMQSIGFTQWGPEYPTLEILSHDIDCGDLFGAYLDGYLVGFAALNQKQSEEYEEIEWKFGEPFFSVHRLQVDPEYRGNSIANKIMLYAQELAKDAGCKAIRLDTRCDNIPALKLYEKLGYQKRGHIHFPSMMEYEFPCLEKEIL